MRKLGIYLLLAGAMGGLSQAQAEESQTEAVMIAPVPFDEMQTEATMIAPVPFDEGQTEATMIAPLPSDEGLTEATMIAPLPVDEALPVQEGVDPGIAVGEPTPGTEPSELVDPPMGEVKPEIGEVDPVDVLVDDSQIVTIGGEEIPADDAKVVGPAPGEMEDGMVYVTSHAPAGIEATSGLANPGTSTGDLSRAGVDEASPPIPAGFPAPMDVMDDAAMKPRPKTH